MKLIDIFFTASGNMFRSKLRTSLTVIAIFIGALTLTLTNGLGSGISTYINKQLGTLGGKDILIVQVGSDSSGVSQSSDAPKKYDPNRKVGINSNGPGSIAFLTPTDIDKIKSQSGITGVDPVTTVSPSFIEGSNGDKYQVTVSPSIPGTHLDLATGKNVTEDSKENQLVLPINYVKSLGYKNNKDAIGKTVTISIGDAFGKEHETTVTITGVQNKTLFGLSGTTINKMLNDQLYDFQTKGLPDVTKQQYQMVFAHFDKNKSSSDITKLKNALKKKGYQAQTVEDRIGIVKTVISGATAVLNGFAVIALLAASFGIINTLLMAVQERTKEIGLMKSMGMSGSRIFLLFSIEAILIGFWGSLLGVGVAEIIGRVVNRIVSNGILKDLTGLQLVAFPAKSIIEVMLLIMAVAFLAGTLPARRAAKQNPIDALRYE